MGPLVAVAVAALLLATDPDAPQPAPAPAAPTVSAVPAVAIAPAGSAMRARFDAARSALLAGDLAAAGLGFEAVAADPTAGVALAETARLLAETSRELARRGEFVLRAPFAGARPGQPARSDRSGRGDLAWFTTFYGISAANALGYLADVEDSKMFLVLTIAGASTGLVGALSATRDAGMSQGRAAAIEAATTWTTANAAALCAISGQDGRTAVGATLGAGLLGLALSIPLTSERAPSAGDMSIVNSAGAWGLVAGALSLTFLPEGEVSGERVGWTLLAATDLGLLAGALTASRVDISRGRMLVIDAGGILGALVGIAIPVFASSTVPGAYGLAALAGISVGLGTTMRLTRDWDDDAPRPLAASRPGVGPALLPIAGGGTAGGIAGRF